MIKTFSQKVIGVIPARYNSVRFPGKPLTDIKGKPMIQRVYEQAEKSSLIDKILVATDDIRIFDCVKGFKGNVIMTPKYFRSGTDRVAEAIRHYPCTIVVNIQGDIPFINPRDIDKTIKSLLEDYSAVVSTLAVKIKNENEISDPNVVKVIFSKNNYALYFSRSIIPFYSSKNIKHEFFKHIGLYVFRRKYLLDFIKLKESKLEKAEKLEQLRILESEGSIKVVITNNDSVSIDTIADLEKLKQ